MKKIWTVIAGIVVATLFAVWSKFPAKLIIGGVGGSVAYFLGGWDKGLEYLLFAVTLDYCFGIITAIYNKKYSYDIAWRGILKKIGFFGIVATSVVLERTIGKHDLIHPLVCYYLVANECFSILKSFKDMGLPIPDIFEKEVTDFIGKFTKGA